ncbi:MAG TPA: tetratricopeptide repeat protein [Pirellulales bacterium]|nr:tetratricopeptide repeat protein [Pirellulales bacterium]
MSDAAPKTPYLESLYQWYLDDADTATFISRVSAAYTVGTLERLAASGGRAARRAAMLALGSLADYESNAVLGRALRDDDRGVRCLAENGLRSLWCRAGDDSQRQRLGRVIQANSARHYHEAIARATELIAEAPGFAEAWNQRAIAYYGSGRYAEAIDDCKQALELNAYHFGAAAGMGECYLRLGRPRLALECFQRALKLNPGLEGVRAHVVALERSMGNA